MDEAQQLVRMISRSFYPVECRVMIDALIKHSALNIDEFRVVFNNKSLVRQEVQKVAGRLKEGGLISIFLQQETKANALKPTNVEYYYIDYRRAVDAIKYRLHTLAEDRKKRAGPSLKKKEYKCMRCKSEWEELEIIDNPDPNHQNSGFLCHTCQFPLTYYPANEESIQADGLVGKLNKATKWINDRLQTIDAVEIPEVTGESAMRDRVKLPKEEARLAVPAMDHSEAVKVKPQTVKGIVGPAQTIEVAITTNSESTAAQQIADAEAKAAKAAQNQLPSWHTHSTVTNEVTSAGTREEAARREREIGMGAIVNDAPEEKKAQIDDVESLFAMIDAQKRSNANEEESEEEESEEEQFEEVIATATPPEAKKVKLDDAATGDVSTATNTPAAEAEESDDDEFEDAS
ncbi:hypothetical protein FKW77_000538 [Venturia effusa]|uniref:Transcription initiation factor IIE subunit alpha N-terminal domain-containing protein n=1 Tax=Venturia effusa TaxID=50376 RepID=A0A517LGD2_9PEZI|nr:hypothetical protein FKW77_000538 [Venturia effusa]